LKGEELKKFSLKRRQIKVSAYALKGREIAMFLPLQREACPEPSRRIRRGMGYLSKQY